jgi:uncharacterized protein YyaL (SSP411 family)
MPRNRLEFETSPYLRQHADNPVDWYPWSEAALTRARTEDKPILLSIGYSACHWCHVMAHESFEDAATAALMNELFINIKVDREERPDLDRIYQIAQQMISHGPGGWPLTMFLTPADQQPFFGGTYFPKEARHGMPAFGDLLKRVAQYYHGHRAEILAQNSQLQQAFASIEPTRGTSAALDDAPLREARAALERSFDVRHGGFTQAPKFPHPGSIERCMRQWYATSDEVTPDLQALYMASLTLTRMAEGGICDQLGGGFARYSVDAQWMIPHFEKMLYDNGQLLCAYANAALATGEALFARTAAATADWVLRDMRAADGGFYSSLDADSQGHEGRFYVWTRAEVQALLSPAQYAAFAPRYGLDLPGNFEGAWHLHTYESLDAIAARLAAPLPEVQGLLDSARAALLEARNRRVWPARDDKILTSWNALMIKGLAIAARVLKRDDLADAAAAAVDFLRHSLWRDGRLLATYKDGRAHLPAYLDDYAFLADALLELLQTRWRTADLEFARELLDVLLTQFEDAQNGGFFFTAADHEKLFHRSKSFGDDSLPSGNAVAASVLCRLGYLLGDRSYLDAAERTLEAGWAALQQYPQAHMALLNALEDWLSPPQVLIVRAAAGAAGMAAAEGWTRQIGAWYAPQRMLFAIPDEAQLPPGLQEKRALDGPTAYLCTGMTCSAPLTDLESIVRQLRLRVIAMPRSAAAPRATDL